MRHHVKYRFVAFVTGRRARGVSLDASGARSLPASADGNGRPERWGAGSLSRRELQVLRLAPCPAVLIVPPGVVHAYQNVGKIPGFVCNFANRLYRGPGRTEAVDEIRFEDDPDSPFRLE